MIGQVLGQVIALLGPAGGRNGSIGANFASGSLASYVTRPKPGWSGIGGTLRCLSRAIDAPPCSRPDRRTVQGATGTDQEIDDLPGIARDPAAFEVFYRLHVVTVTRFVARRVADPHTVADLTAEVFLAVIDSAHTYRRGRGSQRAWLYGVARNVIAGERRRAAAEQGKASRIAGRRLLADDGARSFFTSEFILARSTFAFLGTTTTFPGQTIPAQNAFVRSAIVPADGA